MRLAPIAYCLALAALAPAGRASAVGVSEIGVGQWTCGVWAQSRMYSYAYQRNEELIVQWVAGYLSSENQNLYYRGLAQLPLSDLPTIELWLDIYCGKNPTHVVSAAAAALIQELGGRKTLHQWKH